MALPWVVCLVMFYGSELLGWHVIIVLGLYILQPLHQYSSKITTTCVWSIKSRNFIWRFAHKIYIFIQVTAARTVYVRLPAEWLSLRFISNTAILRDAFTKVHRSVHPRVQSMHGCYFTKGRSSLIRAKSLQYFSEMMSKRGNKKRYICIYDLVRDCGIHIKYINL